MFHNTTFCDCLLCDCVHANEEGNECNATAAQQVGAAGVRYLYSNAVNLCFAAFDAADQYRHLSGSGLNGTNGGVIIRFFFLR